jgi:hypothetical protein
VLELEGKRPLARQRHRLKDNIKTDMREIGWGGIDRIWLRIGTIYRFIYLLYIQISLQWG